MVIVTATPPIMFFAYASHIITRKLSIHTLSHHFFEPHDGDSDTCDKNLCYFRRELYERL